ncbi:SGNH/GDSL hydrolase family protein [Anaeromyxobacter dehalogenans]|uniref:PKD n=1 Tax=Anaeromyxobacter dehalogenans (strain 2CP-C) TaxID=290397 RepID=Q2ILM8_ANADE|nr:SGNH/GDSL hydrolase family protein [Anaeromyxobacter dehalogenans]ABC82556.1 PKD [Anaeromyxobacter dehalogenans 2CP-C]
MNKTAAVVLLAGTSWLGVACGGGAGGGAGGGGEEPPPVIQEVTASSTAVQVGDHVSLAASATDPRSRPLSYAWSAHPAGCGSFSDATAAAPVLTALWPGTCSITVTVSAGGAFATSAALHIAISSRAAGGVPAPMPRVAHVYAFMYADGATATASVSGLGLAVVRWSRAGDTAPWAFSVNDGYDLRLRDGARNVPVDYVIEASADGGSTWPATLATVTGNTYLTRAHVVDLTGYGAVRMRLTSAPRNGGVSFYGTDLDVHDARAGTDDWWLALGDSLTTNVWHVHDSVKFGTRIHARDPGRFPVAHEGGVSGITIPAFLSTSWTGSDGRPIFARWMDDFPGRYVVLAVGTNDCSAGTPIDTMEQGFRQLVQLVVDAGKVPVVPTLRWTYINAATPARIEAWNARLAAICASFPTCVPGPDTFTRAQAQGLAGLQGDQTHLNQAGITLTHEDWDLWAMATVYAAP